MGLKRILEVDPLRFMRQTVRGEQDIADGFKAIEQWANRQLAIGPWIEPTFAANWANFDTTTWVGARYRQEGDLVRVEGLVKTTANVTPASTIFTLPSGLWPPLRLIFSTTGRTSGLADAVLARVDVLATGEVQLLSFGPVAIFGAAATPPYTVAYLSINLAFSTLATPKK
jgi:hypothetical protein